MGISIDLSAALRLIAGRYNEQLSLPPRPPFDGGQHHGTGLLPQPHHRQRRIQQGFRSRPAAFLFPCVARALIRGVAPTVLFDCQRAACLARRDETPDIYITGRPKQLIGADGWPIDRGVGGNSLATWGSGTAWGICAQRREIRTGVEFPKQKSEPKHGQAR
jgi:hypothetical protein